MDDLASQHGCFMKALEEQRQYPRFQIPGLMAYTVVKRGWPRSPLIGDIVDICIGGLSFCYVAKERCRDAPSDLDILLTDGGFHLDEMRLEVIWHFKSADEVFLDVPTWRCGARFVDLTDEQQSDLRYFIQFHTTADPEA